jgi:dTDP-4-dehydrorhamnose 3,5-epimerase
VDLRPDSPTYRKWFGTELSDSNRKMMYVPEGFATGYLTLRDDSEIYYYTSHRYEPGSATGVRFDDPAFGIEWPREITVISDQDRAWPDLAAREPLLHTLASR